jgi:hypothetical protein
MKQITQTVQTPIVPYNISDPSNVGQMPQAPPPPYQSSMANTGHLPPLQQAIVTETGSGPMTKQFVIGSPQIRTNTPSVQPVLTEGTTSNAFAGLFGTGLTSPKTSIQAPSEQGSGGSKLSNEEIIAKFGQPETNSGNTTITQIATNPIETDPKNKGKQPIDTHEKEVMILIDKIKTLQLKARSKAVIQTNGAKDESEKMREFHNIRFSQFNEAQKLAAIEYSLERIREAAEGSYSAPSEKDKKEGTLAIQIQGEAAKILTVSQVIFSRTQMGIWMKKHNNEAPEMVREIKTHY